MKKAIIAWGVFVAFLLSAMPFSGSVSFADEAMVLAEKGFYYIIVEGPSGKAARIISYNGQEEKLSIPETLGGIPVTEIYSLESQNQKRITEISLPKSIAGKGINAKNELNTALSTLNDLSSVTVAEDNPELAAADGVLYTKDFSVMLVYPRAKPDTSYTEPDTVKLSYGYKGNRLLKEITFSSNTDYTAPGKCESSSIEKVVFPPNITAIWTSAFENCTRLKEIRWGGNEKRIGPRAFRNCSSLTDVELPKSLKKLERYAFADCKKLKKIKLPFGLTYIGDYAFASDASMKSITVPDSVLSVGVSAFDSYSHMKVKKALYLKKVPYEETYAAKAKAIKNGKTKNYAAADITGILADEKTVSVKKGKKKTLKTIVLINDRKKGKLDSSILSYKTDNKAVAKVTKKGAVMGVKKGTAQIWVTLRTTGEKYPVKIRVKSGGR